MSQRIDRQQHERELVDLHEGWKNRERELLAHIERLNEEVASWQRVHRAEYEKREALDAHIGRLDKVISDCATAVGAAVGPTCSIEFKEQLPDEIRLKVERLESTQYGSGRMQALRDERDRLKAQIAEAKTLFLHERTEGLTDQEQREDWDDAEEYFERQMEYAAKKTTQQADKGE